MRGGSFPKTHPAVGVAVHAGSTQFGSSSALDKFRARGYWASCFPEGDGITVLCEREQDETTVVKDIQECFGWEVNGRAAVPAQGTPEGLSPNSRVTVATPATGGA